VVRVLGYRSGGLGFDSRALQEKKAVGLERGPFSLVSATEEVLEEEVVGFRKMLRNSPMSKELGISRVVLSSMELVS
jgi:hypothetical protein